MTQLLRRLFAVVVLLATFVPSVSAVQPDEILKDPALEARARALSAELRCLVCQNQSIDDSDAPLAKDLRVLLRERIKAGDSDDQVMAFLVDRYGEFVLLSPRVGWHTALLWFGPFALLLMGMAIIYNMRKRPAPVTTETELSEEEAREVERLMKETDAKS